MLTSLVSDSIVDTSQWSTSLHSTFHFFVLQGHCNLLHPSVAITLIVGSLLSVFFFGQNQYSLNFSIKY